MKNFLYFLVFSVLSGCSPFSGQTLIEGISKGVDQIFKGQAAGEVISGATHDVQTNPGSPAQNYKVSVSVGGQFSQPAVETTSGYKVYTSIQSTVSQ